MSKEDGIYGAEKLHSRPCHLIYLHLTPDVHMYGVCTYASTYMEQEKQYRSLEGHRIELRKLCQESQFTVNFEKYIPIYMRERALGSTAKTGSGCRC